MMIWLCLLIVSQVLIHLFGQELQFMDLKPNKGTRKKDKTIKFQRLALSAWTNNLTDSDYNIDEWPKIAHASQPQHIFDFYAQRLSDVFLENKARVNFILIGACDGTHDKTIRDRFLPNLNWNGVFVEPIAMNFNDLNKFIEQNNATERSITFKAAVTDECATPTVPVKVAKYESKDPNLPHWLRREIGSILSKPSDVLKLGKMWDVEEVPCKTAGDIVSDWIAADTAKRQSSLGRTTLPIRKRKNLPRIHVLKVDAEGHDFQVLTSFLRDAVPSDSLPLLICFEAKSMHENLPRARQIMIERGYVVSEGSTNDGFALLRLEPDIEAEINPDVSSTDQLVNKAGNSQKRKSKNRKGGKRKVQTG